MHLKHLDFQEGELGIGTLIEKPNYLRMLHTNHKQF